MKDRNSQVFCVTRHELTDAAPHSQHLLSVLFQELSLLAQHFLLARRPKHDTDACCSLSMIHILYMPATVICRLLWCPSLSTESWSLLTVLPALE